MDTAAPVHAWVLTTLDAPADDLRRIKVHLARGALLLTDGAEYVRVMQNGPTQPSTTSSGLLSNVLLDPEMNHTAGAKIQSSGLVYLTRKLNASDAAKYACMPRYLLVDPQLNWLSVLPPEDVERTQAAIVPAPPVPVPNVVADAECPVVTVQARNSLLVMGSSLVTASYHLARGNLGMKSALFLMGIGMLSATEFSDTPVFSQGSEWVFNVTSDVRSEFADRMNATWQPTKIALRMVAGSIWLVVLNVIWSYRKRPAMPSVPVTTALMPVAQPVAVQPMQLLPSKTIPTSMPVGPAKPDVINCVSGATSGVDSGVEDVPEVEMLADQCQADKLLIDSNPRSCLSFVPCWPGDLQKCKLMEADGVSIAGNPVSGALGDVALLCSVHLRQYRDRLRLWQCRVEKCREKGHFMEIDGSEIVE